MGVTAKEMEAFTKEEEMAFLANHTKAVSRIIAYTLCRGYVARHLLVGVTAWAVRNLMDQRCLMVAFMAFVRLMGTRPFTSIIRSAEMSNPMNLRLSHERKGS